MDREDRRFYAERLDALWGRYLQFVNFAISLAGGTVLILLIKLVELKFEKSVLQSVPALLWGALLVAAVLAVYAIVWRALAQRFMEYEILAPFKTMNDYVGAERLGNTVTDVHRFEGRERAVVKAAFRAAPWIISLGLLASWSMIGVHLASLV